jgi:hypothetical protein
MNKTELKPNSEGLCIHDSFHKRNCPKEKLNYRSI